MIESIKSFFKFFTPIFFIGVFLGVWANIFVQNSSNHDLFFELKIAGYEIEDSDLKEKYKDWETSFSEGLDELGKKTIREVEIYKIKEKEGALNKEYDKFPCEDYSKYILDYYNFYRMEIPDEAIFNLKKYCDITIK
ncbi:MAG: hypothetical protein IBX44_00035 [Sulfurospirillum sp.]|nr:hypothetical protein [Sulfurospirillum sp.]